MFRIIPWDILFISWWRHQMETFSALLALCAGNSPVTGEFPSQRPVARSFDVFFDQRLNKQLSKQSWGWWSETPSRSLWRDCNAISSSYVYNNNIRHWCLCISYLLYVILQVCQTLIIHSYIYIISGMQLHTFPWNSPGNSLCFAWY